MRTRVAAVVGIVAALTPATAFAVPDTPSRSDDALVQTAKKKRKCKSGRVPVRVLKRTRCKKPRAALPRPRAADMSLLLFREALNLDLGGVRDRRGRRAPTMKKLFRRLGPRAYGFMQRELPRALAAVDRAAAASRSAGAADTKFTCKNLPSLGWAGFSESGPNGLRVELQTNGRDLEVSLEADKGGQHFRLQFMLDGCDISDPTPLPDCPTADGRLRGRSKLKAIIKVALLEDGQFVHKYRIDLDGDTTVEATVGDDAKLDHLTIDDHQRTDEYAPALVQGLFGPMSVHGKAHHSARMNLRTGAYEPGQSKVEVDATLGGLVGVFLGGRFREGAANRVKQESDKLFAATLARAIEQLRERETAWQEPNRCAELQFSPASNTLKLAKDAAGDFSGQVVAKRDGGAAKGRWTRTGQQNATVTPDTAQGEGPSFHYTVTNAGSGVKVTAAFRATSPAGVASGTWTQDTEGEILYLGHVSGTLSWDESPCPFLDHQQFSYSADLEKANHTGGPQIPFPIFDEQIMSHPGAGIAAWGNSESGAGSWSSGPCDSGVSDCPSSPLTPEPDDGHGHIIFSREGDMIKATARSFSWSGHTSDDCDIFWSIPVYGEGHFPVSQVGADTLTIPLTINEHGTEDGITTDYVGSGTLTLHRVN